MGVREYVLATSAEEAASLAGEPGTVLMGGGTLLMPQATAGALGAERVVGLHAAGLDYVRRNGATAIGAMSPLATLATLDDLPALRSAAREVGGWALRSMATLGGNLYAASPYGDLAPVLLALDATVRLVGPDGERTPALADWLTEEGDRRPEVLAEVVVPPPRGVTAHRRHARRAANSPAVASAAVRLLIEDGAVTEARVAIGAVAARALRVAAAEERLTGAPADAAAMAEAADAAAAAASPVDDPVASAWYRHRMTAVCVRQALETALGPGAR
jgi:CO/xanthine dehydrogenase FAD-binding subunit